MDCKKKGYVIMKVVAFATIKLNSQRVPYKNKRKVGSKPLCYHILDTALKVDLIDEVYAYCSDNEVVDYIPDSVIFKKRLEWLDGDEVVAKDTYDAFVEDVDADIYIALCTTSPFTRVETLYNALSKVLSNEYDSAFTARKEQTFAWYKEHPINYDVKNVPKTQDLEPVFIETSAFFIFSKELWKTHNRRIGFHPYIQVVGPIEAVDIDTLEDFEFACAIADSICKI